VKMVAHSFKLH